MDIRNESVLHTRMRGIHDAWCVRNNIPVERKASDDVPMFGRMILTDAELAVLMESQL